MEKPEADVDFKMNWKDGSPIQAICDYPIDFPLCDHYPKFILDVICSLMFETYPSTRFLLCSVFLGFEWFEHHEVSPIEMIFLRSANDVPNRAGFTCVEPGWFRVLRRRPMEISKPMDDYVGSPLRLMALRKTGSF